MLDNLEPTVTDNAAILAGWARSRNDVWIALPILTHWDGIAWTPSGTTRDVSVSALGGTSDDLWAATNSGQMLRKRLK